MADIARHPHLVQRRVGLPHPQPEQGRLGGHDPRPENLRARIRTGRPPEAHHKHHRRDAHVFDRLYGRSGDVRGAQSHARPATETVEARTQTTGREGINLRTGK